MKDKISTIESAIQHVSDGDTVMVGGFGVPGTPFCLIDELVRQGQKNLTLVKNDANEPHTGIDLLLKSGQVDRLVVSHVGLNPDAIRLMNEKRIEVEFCPQGILAERIRAAGAGIPGFLSDIGINTITANGKKTMEFDGKPHLVESALHADVALIHAAMADPFGNHVYAASARNFSPLMALAAKMVILEVESVVSLGSIAPEAIHTAGPFVDCVVPLAELTADYDVIRR